MTLDIVEQALIEKFRQLDQDAQRRIQDLIEREASLSAFNFEAWLAQVNAAQISLHPDEYGYVPSASELVNEVREERDNDILRGLGFGDSTGNSPN